MTTMGCKRDKNAPRKPMKRGGKLRHFSKAGRGTASVLKSLKDLLVQEYHETIPEISVESWRRMDLDHVWGRHADGFTLTAMYSPRNLQLLSRDIHTQKTNAPTYDGQRMDYRPKEIQERMVMLSKRLEEKLGEAWTIAELKKVVESEIYQE